MSRTLLLTGWQRVIAAHSRPARRAHALAARTHTPCPAALRVYAVHCAEREETREDKRKSKNESEVRGGSKRVGWAAAGGGVQVLRGAGGGLRGWGGCCLIIIISSPSMKAVFFASHPGVNHPSYNPCICSTTLHFIGHLELRLW